MLRNALLGVAALLVTFGSAYSQSPYAGQESRAIKALSPKEVSDLLAGKGMGLALAAELNGYPGPAHVLELAAQLQLTPEQKAKTEALFKRMQAGATSVGRQLVDEERALTSSSRPSETHLEQTELLSETHIAVYAKYRGYGGGGDHSEHGRQRY